MSVVVGETAAHLLCEEINRSGCFDTQSQALCFLFMTLGPEVGVQLVLCFLHLFECLRRFTTW
jgi:RNA 3'-terminal phosphate cyclase